jgi:hypothetical protein
MAEKSKKTAPSPDWELENSQILQDIDAELRGTHLSDEVTIFKHRYGLRTLSPEDESWADQFTGGSSEYQVGRSLRAPRVAASLVSIDGKRVEEIFKPKAISDDLRLLFEQVPQTVELWRRERIMQWLVNSAKSLELVRRLYAALTDLERRREEALKKLDPLLETTLIGESSDTSSPEKESY